MAIDYNDPVVAEEFMKVQAMEFDDVEKEINDLGQKVPPDMNEIDAKLKLVEYRLINEGKIAQAPPPSTERKRPSKFGSKFDELQWSKPKLRELYDGFMDQMDYNNANVVVEYCNDKEMAENRYTVGYKDLMKKVEAIIMDVSDTVEFSGFPANMGEDACKQTLSAMGDLKSFECSTSDDGMSLKGKATYEDKESARKAIQEYDGMDMGLGSAIEMVSV